MIRKRVLVAPLDWGLGHATRCIPVIHELLKRNCEVFIASSGSALGLLQKEFPNLKFFRLRPYRVKYTKSGSLILSLIFQIPRIWRVISKEYHQIQQIILENKIDLVISENRYGCWSKNVPTVFVGHQLSIQFPAGWKVFQSIVNYFHHRMIRKFSQVWIPDENDALNLTGKLSQANFPVRHIGILSRFKKIPNEIKYDIAVILSGPEPQRTMLEEIILKQTHNLTLKIIVVRGVVEREGNWKEEGNLVIANFLQSVRLEEVMNQSKLVISRSGYSTIMDLASLGKKAILIPTPGQTEQEYLAQRLMSKNIFYCMDQKNFDLTKALSESIGFLGFTNIGKESDLLSKAIDDALK